MATDKLAVRDLEVPVGRKISGTDNSPVPAAGGPLTLTGGDGGGAGLGGPVNITAGSGTTGTGAGGAINLIGGPGGTGAATAGGAVNLTGGTGNGAGFGGSVVLDGGTGGTNGNVEIGVTTAQAVNIGRTAKLTSLLGELATPQTPMALVNGANNDIDVTAAVAPVTGGLGKIYYRISGPTAAFSTSGFADTVDGRIIIVQNPTSQNWTIVNNATSTAAFRILTQTGADVVLSGLASAWFIYSAADARWILLGTQEADAAGADTLHWAATGNGSTALRFLNQWAALGAVLTTETLVSQILIPGNTRPRTLRNARVILTAAPGGVNTNVFTVRINGVATAITITITGAATTGSDLVNTVVVNPGDRVSVSSLRSGGTNPGNHDFSVEMI